MFFHTGAYTEYPLVQIEEGYGAEDLEPDNDPGGILRDIDWTPRLKEYFRDV